MTARSIDIAQARRGFTLAELVVVMTIMATLAAIAVPRFAAADARFRADGAANQIADAIRDAATQARSRSATVRIRANAAGDNFNAGFVSPLEYIALFQTNARPFNADLTRVDFANAGSRLDINGFGEFSTSSILAVRVGAQTRTIMVDAASGTVTVGSTDDAAKFQATANYR